MTGEKNLLGYLDRNPCTAWDVFTFTNDGVWHEDGLDLSAIVPPQARAVILGVLLENAAVGKKFEIRRNSVCVGEGRCFKTLIGGDACEYQGHFNIDDDRKLDYWLEAIAWTQVKVKVLGWWR